MTENVDHASENSSRETQVKVKFSQAKAEKPRILVVDDESFYLSMLSESLQDDYRVSVAKNGEQALKIANGDKPPDLILLDVVMPGVDGYATCEKLKEKPYSRDIPVIFLTSRSDESDELKGFALGAVDYITKPLNIPLLKIRLKTHMALAKKRFALEQLVEERTREVSMAKDAVVFCMAAMAESRDNETGKHIVRTGEYVRLLAEALSKTDKYINRLSKQMIDIFYRAAPLHDIGKIAVADKILQKPGALDEDERREMDRHVVYGRDTLLQAQEEIGKTPFLEVAKELVYSHHEKWDGSGYPEGLEGEDIPLAARLMAVADVYDALMSKRHYKEKIPREKVIAMIIAQSGKHFDPEVIQVFKKNESKMFEIWEGLRDD